MVLGAAGRAVVATGFWFEFGFGFGFWFGFRSACTGVVPDALGIVALKEAGLGLGPIVGNSPEVAVLGVTVLGVTKDVTFQLGHDDLGIALDELGQFELGSLETQKWTRPMRNESDESDVYQEIIDV